MSACMRYMCLKVCQLIIRRLHYLLSLLAPEDRAAALAVLDFINSIRFPLLDGISPIMCEDESTRKYHLVGMCLIVAGTVIESAW